MAHTATPAARASTIRQFRRIGKDANNRERLHCIPIRGHFRVFNRMRICLISRRGRPRAGYPGEKTLPSQIDAQYSDRVFAASSLSSNVGARICAFDRCDSAWRLRLAPGLVRRLVFWATAVSWFLRLCRRRAKRQPQLRMLGFSPHALVDDCTSRLVNGAAARGRGRGAPHLAAKVVPEPAIGRG